MKKISLYALGLFAATSFVACDNFEYPNPPAQSNPKPDVIQVDDVTVDNALNSGTTYDLQTLNNSNEKILVATVSCPDLPADFEFGADAYISNNNFANQYPVAASVAPADEEGMFNVYVAPDALQATFSQYISKAPSAKQIGIRFLLTAVKGDQVAYIGGMDNYYSYSLTVLPFPSQLVIEDNYYLIGTIDDWSVVGAIKMTHSDLSPYDDPVFSVKIDITQAQAADGWWWKIIPQSTYDLGDWSSADYSQYGPTEDGTTEASGSIMPNLNGVDPGAGKFMEAGSWLLTINMIELTYEFTSAVEQLYTPGDTNGWSQTASQRLTTTDFVNYTGYAYLGTGGFKFTVYDTWVDGFNLGASGTDGVLSNDSGAGNLTVPETGLYWVQVNLPAMTYTVTQVTTIGLVGDATAGGWDASTPLTPSSDFLTWTGEVNLGDGQFKFRANDGWDINLGANANEEPSGNFNDLVQNGKNLASPGAGTYTVTLRLGQIPYSCSVVKK